MNSPWFKLACYMVATFCTTFTGAEIVIKLVTRLSENPDQPMHIHWFVWVFVLLLCLGQCALTARAFTDGSLARHLDAEKAKDDAGK